MAGTVWPASAAVNNPIKSIQVTTDGSFTLANLGPEMYVKAPSAFSVEIDDISNPDAGRTASGRMIKSQLYVNGKAIRAKAISLEWQNISDADIAGLLTVFHSAEYLYVTYFNPGTNNYKSDWMYIGNRTMPMYNKPMKLWTALSLKLITRN